MKRITSLTPGERVIGKFQGSKKLGNAPYEEEVLTFVTLTESEQGPEALFRMSGGLEFSVYKWNGRWCYGASAEKFSIAPLETNA